MIEEKDVLDWLNGQWPPSVETLQGSATAFDLEAQRLVMRFVAGPSFCHSGNVVQGGYITAMLDATMAYACMAVPGLCETLASLEIKVSFMAPGRPGVMEATGHIVSAGRSIGFLDGELRQEGKLIAKATSTVKFLAKTRT